MRRAIPSAILAGAFSACFLIGCADESSTKVQETTKDTGGTTTTTVDKTVKSTGSNPPANTEGETGKTGK
jgi:hypothetical protein